MASQPIPMEPKYIIDLVIKRRWIVIVPFFLAMIVGIALAIKLPKVYEASTLILIQPQRVPKTYVQSIISTDPSERIGTLSQQVLSRTNLEKLIAEFKLFRGPEYSNMYMEDKLENIRERISINVKRDRQGNDAFSISFQDKKPKTVMNVANALASYFINENLKIREAQAVGTSSFLDAELQTMKKRLEEVEAQLKNYRESYMGELPEQLDSNLRILDRLQARLGENQQSLSQAKIRLVALQNEAVAIKNQSTTVIIGQPNNDEPSDIIQMKSHLDSLLNRYTPRHPDVVRLKARISEMEAKAQRAAESHPVETDGGESSQNQTVLLPPEYRIQYSEIKQEIKRLELSIEDTRKQIAIYQKRIEITPKREQELLSLRRDYENINTAYDSLLTRKLESEIAVNMERKQKGEQFRVLDPAILPQKPVKPNMKKLFILIVGAGLAFGGGIVFVLEYMDNSFKRPEDIEKVLKLPVLCSIPQIIDQKARTFWRLEFASCAVLGTISIVLFVGFAILTLMGVEPTFDLVKNLVKL